MSELIIGGQREFSRKIVLFEKFNSFLSFFIFSTLCRNFPASWKELFDDVFRSAFFNSSGTFWGRVYILGKKSISLYHFRNKSEKISEYFWKIFVRLFKNALYLSRKVNWIKAFFFKKVVFRKLAEDFPVFAQQFSARFVKVAFDGSRWKFLRTWFFFKKGLRMFLYIERKCLELVEEFLHKLCQNWNIPVLRYVLRTKIFFKERNFQYFWKLRQKSSNFSLTFFPRGCQNCILCVQRNNSTRNTHFFQKNYQFRKLSKNFPAF